MKATLYNQKGKETDSIELPENIFGIPWNADMVHQVVTGMLSNKRAGTADAKDRSEVSGGGKKPWRQKGTGRARHASIRSPIWIGGGVTHGPLAERNYKKKINKKMKLKTLFTVLSRKARQNEILFVDALSFPKIKTQDAAGVLSALSKVKGFEKISGARKPVAYIALPESSDSIQKSFRNIKGVTVTQIRELNPVDLLKHRYLMIVDPTATFKALSAKQK